MSKWLVKIKKHDGSSTFCRFRVSDLRERLVKERQIDSSMTFKELKYKILMDLAFNLERDLTNRKVTSCITITDTKQQGDNCV